jgi:alpha-beta hydrolase superfamily lysophospholipase
LPVDAAVTGDTFVARPRFIAAAGRPLFAWHHAPPSQRRRGAGIVVCPPLGHEYMSAYRTLRILADRLASLGFDTLRLDYDGTGNSAGSDEDPHRVDAWLRSIESGIAEVRTLSGSPSVALLGLRAGALLALRAAAANGGVERLVLWNPFASGRAYVRELKAIARFSREEHASDDEDEGGVNAAGYFMARETLEALEGWTVDNIVAPPAAQVLLVNRDDRQVDSTLAGRLDTLGSHVTQTRPGGTAAMMESPQFAKVPEQALQDIAHWFSDWNVPSLVPLTDSPRAEQGDARLVIQDEYRERAIRFGPGRRLFGLFTSPSHDTSDAPAIVLFNTGVEYHVGPRRLYVPLARYWATQGHVVLRYDLGGVGESAPPSGAEENIAYPAHMLDDACEAIAFVQKEAPRRRLIVAGLCSGGWLAFRAAREGLPVDAIICMNPPLYLRDADGMRWGTERDELRRYRKSMADWSKWLKALRGQVSYATFTRLAANSLGRHMTVRVNGACDDETRDGLARDLRRIAERGIRSLFVFSRGDDGLEYFRLHAQPVLESAWARDLVRHVVLDGAGHSLRPRSAQRALGQILTAFVASQRTALTAPTAVPVP